MLNTDGITDNDYLYSGEQFDAQLDNYYLRARYYDQNVGRFTQMDEWMGKACTPITLNKYVYANADPIQYTDPTGFYSMADLQASMNVRQVLSTNSRGVQTVGFSYTKIKGKKSVTKAITCQVGVAYVKREYSRDRVHGHHPINKNLGGADNQSLIYLPANTHRMFHFVLHHLLLDEPAFRNMGNWTKKQNWNVISQSPAGRKALYKAILKASGMVDSYCGLKRKPTSLTNFVKKNRKHFVGNY
ncbi:RHS repeat-associated core domain-containing protein [Alteromonas sp. PRIM-21]|nr:RHS repeat-associated core domain-containing protein [Alteromonas sp. PRIM-21]